MNDIILGRKLRNAIEKHIQGMEYHLHTINVNGDKRGYWDLYEIPITMQSFMLILK